MERALAESDVRVDDHADKGVQEDENKEGREGLEAMGEEAVEHDGGAEEH